LPIYEYQCTQCGHRFEQIQKFSDPLVENCPQCGGKVEQLLSAPAVQFKGSGWYVTDYARKGSGGGKKDGSSESKTGDKGGESKGEGKSESKPGSDKK